jgi:hypothetical protein
VVDGRDMPVACYGRKKWVTSRDIPGRDGLKRGLFVCLSIDLFLFLCMGVLYDAPQHAARKGGAQMLNQRTMALLEKPYNVSTESGIGTILPEHSGDVNERHLTTSAQANFGKGKRNTTTTKRKVRPGWGGKMCEALESAGFSGQLQSDLFLCFPPVFLLWLFNAQCPMSLPYLLTSRRLPAVSSSHPRHDHSILAPIYSCGCPTRHNVVDPEVPRLRRGSHLQDQAKSSSKVWILLQRHRGKKYMETPLSLPPLPEITLRDLLAKNCGHAFQVTSYRISMFYPDLRASFHFVASD